MSRYATARALLNIASVAAWIAIAASGLLAIIAYQNAGIIAAIGTLAAGALLGATAIAMIQMALATLDTADNSERMVQILTTIQKQGAEPATAPSAPATFNAEAGTLIKTHKGRRIVKEAVGVSVDGNPFNNVLSAEKWIDGR